MEHTILPNIERMWSGESQCLSIALTEGMVVKPDKVCYPNN